MGVKPCDGPPHPFWGLTGLWSQARQQGLLPWALTSGNSAAVVPETEACRGFPRPPGPTPIRLPRGAAAPPLPSTLHEAGTRGQSPHVSVSAEPDCRVRRNLGDMPTPPGSPSRWGLWVTHQGNGPPQPQPAGCSHSGQGRVSNRSGDDAVGPLVWDPRGCAFSASPGPQHPRQRLAQEGARGSEGGPSRAGGHSATRDSEVGHCPPTLPASLPLPRSSRFRWFINDLGGDPRDSP